LLDHQADGHGIERPWRDCDSGR